MANQLKSLSSLLWESKSFGLFPPDPQGLICLFQLVLQDLDFEEVGEDKPRG